MQRRLHVLAVLLMWPTVVYAETVVLKSGRTLEAKVLERTDTRVRLDLAGVPVTYFVDEIASIDGKPPYLAAPEGAAKTVPEPAGGKPSVKDVEPVLRNFLISLHQKDCPDGLSAQALAIRKIGDYDGTLGGWPVYADYEVRCDSGIRHITLDQPKNLDAVTAYVRRNGAGALECFVPEIFGQAMDGLKKAMNKMADSLGRYVKSDASPAS